MTREEAIKYLAEYSSTNGSGRCTQEQHEEAKRMAIQALSQEPTVTSTDEPMTMVYPTIVCDDAISRKAVLSIIGGWYEQNRETENIEDLIILITYMDSVTPKSRECEDVISRAEVKRIVDFYKEQYDGIYHINESIDNLPSVTQKPNFCASCKHNTDNEICLECEYDGITRGMTRYESVTQKSGKWDRLYSWLNDMRLGIAPDETVDDIDERHCREAQTDILDEIMEWMIKAESEDKE